ncbi:MAG: vanadium-dependent haloperoxidase, partial [Candidatus Kapabacteria bacterium]|nr:vanadium-dependent haloperoxidase [Candidatus Kapabacteria bacterium]
MTRLLFLLLVVVFNQPIHAQTLDGAEIIHQWNRCAIDVIMEDGFGPPIAARIHSYSNLAAYQASFYSEPGYVSMVGMLNGFTSCPVPKPDLVYDYRVAAVAALQVSCSKLLYRIVISDKLASEQFSVLSKVVPADVFARSKEFGTDVGKAIIAYAKGDGYARTQGLPDYEWPRCDSCWVPTPPNFAKPLSPYCGRVRTVVLKGPNEFPVPPSIPFSVKKGSAFYNAALEVISTNKSLTDEQRQIANFWNDNPVLTNYHGHFVFNSRQISPGGHWMNIAERVLRDKNASMVRSLEVYSMTAFSLFDGFTACWAEKYRGNLIRPVTYINSYIDKSWEPLLQTPPFPAYTSGHSTFSGAASRLLTKFYGSDEFAFETTSEGLPGVKR